MKQYFVRKVVIAGFVMLAVPASLWAQKEKEKEEKDKGEVEQIIITRKGNADKKTVIEIDGDQVKVNGKNADDLKDEEVTVRRNKLRDLRALSRARVGNGQNWNFNFDEDHISLFSEDANRAMLGVVTEPQSSEKVTGARIASVSKESAAEKAGLKKGDIITRIGDHKIENSNDVAEAVKSHKPGDKVAIAIVREGKDQKVTAELGKWKGINVGTITAPRVFAPDVWVPEAPGAPMPPVTGNLYIAGGQPRLGIAVQDTEDGKGVKVLEVTEDSNAAKAGIKKDDVITQINDEEVNSADEISRVVRSNRTEPSMKMKVLRNGKTQTIEVKTPRKLKTTNL